MPRPDKYGPHSACRQFRGPSYQACRQPSAPSHQGGCIGVRASFLPPDSAPGRSLPRSFFITRMETVTSPPDPLSRQKGTSFALILFHLHLRDLFLPRRAGLVWYGRRLRGGGLEWRGKGERERITVFFYKPEDHMEAGLRASESGGLPPPPPPSPLAARCASHSHEPQLRHKRLGQLVFFIGHHRGSGMTYRPRTIFCPQWGLTGKGASRNAARGNILRSMGCSRSLREAR